MYFDFRKNDVLFYLYTREFYFNLPKTIKQKTIQKYPTQ